MKEIQISLTMPQAQLLHMLLTTSNWGIINNWQTVQCLWQFHGDKNQIIAILATISQIQDILSNLIERGMVQEETQTQGEE